MQTINILCFKSGIKCYQKTKIFTDDEINKQFVFWNVHTIRELLQRWNQQLESKIN